VQPLAGFASASADADAAAISCPANSYCPAGSNGPKSCPTNTESPAGSDAIDDCVAAAGYFGEPGKSAVQCGAGYYCPEGAEEQTPCPANTDSPGDTLNPPGPHDLRSEEGGAGGVGAGVVWREQRGGQVRTRLVPPRRGPGRGWV
jgi:hypothetical protein